MRHPTPATSAPRLKWLFARQSLGAAALLLALSCAQKQEPSTVDVTASSSAQHNGPAAPLPSASSASSPSPASSADRREVPLDGGTARIETADGGLEHVSIVSADGGTFSESTCEGPAQGYNAVRAFFTQFRNAALSAQPDALLDLLAFPLRVNAATTRTLQSREQFTKQRARIFTADVLAKIRAADPARVFCNSHGDMLGDGVAWAELQPNGQLAVSVINVGHGTHH